MFDGAPKELQFQSTHPRGVRRREEANARHLGISIHAPTWGATDLTATMSCNVWNFNPRTHVGCDRENRPLDERIAISIHAPTWGATLSMRGLPDALSDFNPRTHVGCDFFIFSFFMRPTNFNPRTHVGCDVHRVRVLRVVYAISIHAPTWGAT